MLKNIDTNAISPILLTKKILPSLIKNNGAVVNMISTMSTVGVPGRMPYCISKSALKSFSDVLRCELKYQNVQVLTVYPEVMSTPFWENVLYFGRIKNAMFKVVNENKGTAFKSRIQDIKFAGKTGTSQVRRISLSERESDDFREKEQEWKNRDHALFVGYMPYDDPKYSISVIIEHGGSGASTAAPIAKQIFSYINELEV